MSAQMPELGSKISLISKADIRYEGRLFTVDPQECTIALASVRSFGTEDRETQYPVPAQSQVYDYILFRGSDIKDIRVVNTQLPNDPAIVQMAPSIGQQGNYQTQAFGHPVMGPQIGSIGQYAGYGGMGGLGGLTSGNMALQRAQAPLLLPQSELGASGSAPGPPHPDVTPPQLQPSNVSIGPLSIEKEQDLIGGASRSTTPSLTRKSPTNDQGTQVNNSPGRDEHKKPRPIQPPQRDSTRQRDQREQPLYQAGPKNQRDRDYQGESRDLQYRRGGYKPRENQSHERMVDREKRESRPRDYQNQNRGGNGSNNAGGWGQRMNTRQRPNRSRGPPKQYNRQGGPAKKNTLKFESDYDFDKANNEFEELRSQLSKCKLGNEDDVSGPSSEAKVNGEVDKKEDDIGNVENEQEEDYIIPEPCYDKSKSFFDTISCEAVERSKGRSQRTDWRTERKLNSETFGVASTRRGPGFRGRGYYGGRNYRPPQGGFRPRGPRTDRTGSQPQSDNKPNVTEEKDIQKSVPLQGVPKLNSKSNEEEKW